MSGIMCKFAAELRIQEQTQQQLLFTVKTRFKKNYYENFQTGVSPRDGRHNV